jgi:hypothetical protein
MVVTMTAKKGTIIVVAAGVITLVVITAKNKGVVGAADVVGATVCLNMAICGWCC